MRPVIGLMVAFACLFMFFAAGGPTTAAYDEGSGVTQNFWKDHAVVVAHVISSRKVKVAAAAYDLRLDTRLSAVIETEALLAVDQNFTIRLAKYNAGLFPEIKDGDSLLLCILKRDDGRWVIPDASRFVFLPGGKPTLVKGPDDPLVASTCKFVRKLVDYYYMAKYAPPKGTRSPNVELTPATGPASRP